LREVKRLRFLPASVRIQYRLKKPLLMPMLKAKFSI
jgi:hypothetical protein